MSGGTNGTAAGVPRRWAGVALVAGVIAFTVQAILIPLRAAPQFGLLANQSDLEIYRSGALQVLHNASLYLEPVPPGGWFTYPPFAAIVFMPLAWMPLAAAQSLVFVVSCAALWVTMWRCSRVLGYRGDRNLAVTCLGLSLLAVDLESVRGTLWQDQINLILMAVIVWDLTRPKSARWRGWTVGLATGVKLTAVVFLPYLLFTKQWRAALSATVFGAATVLIAWIAVPADSREYWLHAVHDVDRIGPVTHPLNQSINGVLANLWAPESPPAPVWILLVILAAVLGYGAAVKARRAGRDLLGIVIVGLLACVTPPLAWSHHWVWIAPLLIILLHNVIQEQPASRGLGSCHCGSLRLRIDVVHRMDLRRDRAPRAGGGAGLYSRDERGRGSDADRGPGHRVRDTAGDLLRGGHVNAAAKQRNRSAGARGQGGCAGRGSGCWSATRPGPRRARGVGPGSVAGQL